MASLSEEKVGFENVENQPQKGGSDVVAPTAADDFGFTPEEQKKIIQRVDRRLVLTVGAMYCISLMDRTNLGAVNIAGMGTDLVLVGDRYVRIFLCFTRPALAEGAETNTQCRASSR